MRTSVDYDRSQHAVYARARALTPASAALWREVLGRYLDGRLGSTVLDLGCGTGRYSRLIAESFGVDVVGVEPSTRMREAAAREGSHPRVRYLAGSGERVPLPDASCDAALLSDVAHHLDDPAACARELHRVLRPDATLLVRGILPESLPGVAFIEFFPPARPIAERQTGAYAEFLETLEANGFASVAREAIEQEVAPSLSAYRDRVGLRAISTLELIDDAEFEAGMKRMSEAAERAVPARPVVELVNLAVLRRD